MKVLPSPQQRHHSPNLGATSAATTATTVGGAGAAAAGLPQYLIDRREKARAYAAAAALGPHHALESAVGLLPGAEASLRLCAESVEGAVLALGVPTAHRLITAATQAREVAAGVAAAYRAATVARAEEQRLQTDLLDSVVTCYAALRDKNDALERDRRRTAEDRDRKDAAADVALRYVHGLIAERAVWQEAHGPNPLDLPVEGLSFAERTVAALDSLKAMRLMSGQQQQYQQQLPAGGEPVRSPPTTTSLPSAQPTTPLPPLVLSSTTPAAAGGSVSSFATSATAPLHQSSTGGLLAVVATANANVAGGGGGGGGSISSASPSYPSYRSTGAAGSLLPAAPSPDSMLLLSRLRSSANARHSAAAPHARLHYVPPQEEVQLLRSVLAMGTGSTTLMLDILAAGEALDRHRAQVHAECAILQRATHSLRRDLAALRSYLRDLTHQGQPFVAMREEVTQLMTRRIGREARDMAQAWVAEMSAMELDETATGQAGSGSAPNMRNGYRGSGTGSRLAAAAAAATAAAFASAVTGTSSEDRLTMDSVTSTAADGEEEEGGHLLQGSLPMGDRMARQSLSSADIRRQHLRRAHHGQHKRLSLNTRERFGEASRNSFTTAVDVLSSIHDDYDANLAAMNNCSDMTSNDARPFL